MTRTFDSRPPIAPSVSPEARAILEQLRAFIVTMQRPEVPQTLVEFDAAAARAEQGAALLTNGPIAELSPAVTPRVIGGVPALEILPEGYADDGTAIVYIHGGGFVQGSARANLLTAAVAAATTGRRIISLDYTLAPRATHTVILDQVAAAWSALLRERPAHAMGLFGDSAGGCIAASTTLLLRGRGVAMPGALVLLSPVVDLAGGGDTNVTLAPADFLDTAVFAVARNVYAPGADTTDPLVSPVHGAFAQGFPPVLLQVGTRELLLSDSVRLHRALRAAGQSSRLEVFEGMPHVFQPLLAKTPEGRAAWQDMAQFWRETLRA